MKLQKYTIYKLSAIRLLSAAMETDDGFILEGELTDTSKDYLYEVTSQDDCPVFYEKRISDPLFIFRKNT